MEYELEKYTGAKSRFTCPSCGSGQCFARYKDERGEYLSTDVGRCNRESKCGYHKKPKDFYFENPHLNRTKKAKRGSRISSAAKIKNSISPSAAPDFIERDMLLRTLTNYEQNSFVGFLLDLFPEDVAIVEKAVKDYLVGTTKEGKTVFWQIDRQRRVRTGKIIAYDAETGKRRKDVSPNWVHAELKKAGRLKTDFNLCQCFFGEHLLTAENEKPVAIVEAEKTAVIASICFSEFNWLATGAKQNLSASKIYRLGNRQIILYPDADGFALWQQVAFQSRLYGASIKVSNLLENRATDEQKANGYDLADYLIEEQTLINRHNQFVDAHNARIDAEIQAEQFIRSHPEITSL